MEFILELLSNEWDYETKLENYPHLEKEDIYAAINYARIRVKEEKIYPVKV